MAVYKGREVIVLGKSDGEDTSPLYTIQHMNGEREMVQLNKLQMTDQELKEQGQIVQNHLQSAQKIDDKDLKALRDSQDRSKIEAEQAKNPRQGFVEADKVYVDADQVKDKSTITPQMKSAKK